MDNNNLIHNLDNKAKMDGFTYGKFFIFVAVAVILGTAIGFGASKLKKTNTATGVTNTKAEKTIGIADKKNF